jgi:hypothetical protein
MTRIAAGPVMTGVSSLSSTEWWMTVKSNAHNPVNVLLSIAVACLSITIVIAIKRPFNAFVTMLVSIKYFLKPALGRSSFRLSS